MITREQVMTFLETLKGELRYELGHGDDIERIVDELFEEEFIYEDEDINSRS